MTKTKSAPLSMQMALGLWLTASSTLVFGQEVLTVPVPEIYTCVDANGRKHTSDRRIAECADREQKILNPSGTVKARIAPTLTAQERSQLELKNKATQSDRARLEEDKKRDRALLVRYPTVASHQKEREQALSQVVSTRQASMARTLELETERAKLADDMAFYQKDPTKAPTKLRAKLAEIDDNLAMQRKFMAEKVAEIERINARFDAELVRLKQLL